MNSLQKAQPRKKMMKGRKERKRMMKKKKMVMVMVVSDEERIKARRTSNVVKRGLMTERSERGAG